MRKNTLGSFWEKIEKNKGLSSCWTWTGAFDPKGYPTIVMGRKQFKAHRLSYSLYHNVELKNTDVVSWSCGSEICINPKHLVLKTKRDVIHKQVRSKKTNYDKIIEIIANPTETSECIRFPGKVGHQRYGRFSRFGKFFTAHILIWETNNGPVPEGLEVCHSCDNSWCVQVSHLYVASHRQNIIDMVARGRHPSRLNPEGTVKGERHGRSKLKTDQVLEIRKLYETGNYKQLELAKIFTVHKETIGSIVRRKKWRHI